MGSGGILALSRQGATSKYEEDDDPLPAKTPCNAATPRKESDKFPFPLDPPGMTILCHHPKLITEIYPPGYFEVDENGPFSSMESTLMQQENPEVLSQIIRGKWLVFCYRAKSCPLNLWQWLFQIMCLCADENLASAAYSNLTSLIQVAGEGHTVYIPSPQDVENVLVELGFDKDRLSGLTVGESKETGEVHAPPVPSLTTSLSNLLNYLSLVLEKDSSALSYDDLYHLISIMAVLSLDSLVTKDPYLRKPLTCLLSSILAAFPESQWASTCSTLSSYLLLLSSSHHHNILYMSQLFMAHSLRQRLFQRQLCRKGLWKIVFPSKDEATLGELPDWALAWRVVEHYRNQPASKFEYYGMYSVMCLVRQLTVGLEWPSATKKRDFKEMLGVLGSTKIKDHPERRERAPVKDLIISMSLEIVHHRSRDTQLDLFSSFGR